MRDLKVVHAKGMHEFSTPATLTGTALSHVWSSVSFSHKISSRSEGEKVISDLKYPRNVKVENARDLISFRFPHFSQRVISELARVFRPSASHHQQLLHLWVDFFCKTKGPESILLELLQLMQISPVARHGC